MKTAPPATCRSSWSPPREPPPPTVAAGGDERADTRHYRLDEINQGYQDLLDGKILVIDPLPELVALCRDLGPQLHVDAAWAGALALSDRMLPVLEGISDADSITVDAHKWLSMPMGAGMFLATDPRAVQETFRVTTGYMPSGVEDTSDPYVHSLQWSRRAIGLKLFLTLATVGRDGYARQLEHDRELGELLRRRLRAAGWRAVNDTPLPVVCFVEDAADVPDPRVADARHEAIAGSVVAGGRAWISTVRIGGRTALRACITSFHTTSSAIDTLVEALAEARAATREAGG